MSPILVADLTKDEFEELISQGWRTFTLNGLEFIVEDRNRKRPMIGGQMITGKNAPFATFAHDFVRQKDGTRKRQRFDLVAFPYSTITIQDIDDLVDAPKSLTKLPGVKGYIWTDRGLHIYQSGKHSLIDGADLAYEHMSKYNRGWYGERTINKSGSGRRVLITTDEELAKTFLLAGGDARVVRDINMSYIASKKWRD